MKNPITAAIIDSMTAPAPAHTITVTWTNGTRATYSANMLDMLRTDPAALDIQDDETGELVYIKPDPDADAMTADVTAGAWRIIAHGRGYDAQRIICGACAESSRHSSRAGADAYIKRRIKAHPADIIAEA